MKKIYIIAVIAAVLSGILLFTFLNGYEKKDKVVTSNSETEVVVVAVTDIASYTQITSDMVVAMNVPKGTSHPNAARKVEDVVGKVTSSKIVPDEEIILSKLSSNENGGTSLSYQIPKGMRAMTIAVGTTTGVGGYIEEGDLVDILVNFNATPTEDIKVNDEDKSIKGSITSTIVEAAQVIKMGDVTNEGTSGIVHTSMTLLLTPEQCQELYAAENLGELKVILREKTDKEKNSVKSITSKDIVK